MKHLGDSSHFGSQPLGEIESVEVRPMKEYLEKSGQWGPAQMNRASSQLMQSIVAYAHVPTSELHQRGVPGQIIARVEANRVVLQQIQAERRNLQNQQLRLTNQDDAQGLGDQIDHLVDRLANSLYLRGPGPQRNPAASPAILAHQHFMQQQQNTLNLLQDNNFLDSPQPQHAQRRQLQRGPPMQTMRLTTEYLEEPRLFIQSMKQKMNTISTSLSVVAVKLLILMSIAIPSIPPVDVPVERQAEYLNLLDIVHARCLKVEPKLAIYLALFGKVKPIVGLAAIVCVMIIISPLSI